MQIRKQLRVRDRREQLPLCDAIARFGENGSDVTGRTRGYRDDLRQLHDARLGQRRAEVGGAYDRFANGERRRISSRGDRRDCDDERDCRETDE